MYRLTGLPALARNDRAVCTFSFEFSFKKSTVRVRSPDGNRSTDGPCKPSPKQARSVRRSAPGARSVPRVTFESSPWQTTPWRHVVSLREPAALNRRGWSERVPGLVVRAAVSGTWTVRARLFPISSAARSGSFNYKPSKIGTRGSRNSPVSPTSPPTRPASFATQLQPELAAATACVHLPLHHPAFVAPPVSCSS